MISKIYNIMNYNSIKNRREQINLQQILAISEKLKIPYPLKSYYNNIIPLNIYQTWHTKNLPPLMKKSVDLIKRNNPSFSYYLFDDNDCVEFIKIIFLTKF